LPSIVMSFDGRTAAGVTLVICCDWASTMVKIRSSMVAAEVHEMVMLVLPDAKSEMRMV